MQRYDESTPFRPSSSNPTVVKQKQYPYSLRRRDETDDTMHATGHTTGMGQIPHASPQHAHLPAGAMPCSTPLNTLSPHSTATHSNVRTLFSPSVPIPPATNWTQTAPNPAHTPVPVASLQTPATPSQLPTTPSHMNAQGPMISAPPSATYNQAHSTPSHVSMSTNRAHANVQGPVISVPHSATSSHAPAAPSHVSMPTNHVNVNAQGTVIGVPPSAITSHAPTHPGHVSVSIDHHAQGLTMTMPAPQGYNYSSQTAFNLPTAAAMIPTSMTTDATRQPIPVQAYMPPRISSLPAQTYSTYALQANVQEPPGSIQSTMEIASVPLANQSPHVTNYSMSHHPSYRMHAPSPSARHPHVYGQNAQGADPMPSSNVYPAAPTNHYFPQMQIDQYIPQSSTLGPGQTNYFRPPASPLPTNQMHGAVQATTFPHMSARPPPVQPSHGGFTQTHQVKNVQVFSGGPDCKILIDDWIRDMQYLLDAGGLPSHLSFSTIVRHLSGEARRLVLNLPPPEQTPERVFDELRAEYGDMQRSLDPLADFYERSQHPGESACSYAIALEATLREVEEAQNGGWQFPDRDAKLTRQFLRGLIDEEVYSRIAPMKPRLLGFRELQVELRNLARETKRFNVNNRQKKTFSQVQVAGDKQQSGRSGQAEAGKHDSELSELTALVRNIALNQEEQSKKLAHLESKINTPQTPAPVKPRIVTENRSGGAPIVCHRCGKPNHIARLCRSVLPTGVQVGTPTPSVPDVSTATAGQHLNC